MRVLVLVKATADSEGGVLPGEDLLTAMGAYNAELVDAGVLVSGEGLLPSGRGRRVSVTGGTATVEPGPFPLAGLVSGFWVWQVASLDEAEQWLRRAPFVDTELELRQIASPEDFGDALTPKLRDQEEALRARAAGTGA